MKKLSRIVSLVIVAILSFCMFVACAPTPVTLKQEFPTEVDINDTIDFKEYYEQAEGAKYNLYVSYVDPTTGEEVTEEKLSSKIYSFEIATVYTFKIEQVIKDKSSFLEVTIEALPDAPKVNEDSARTANMTTGQTKTFVELINATGINITPADVIPKAKFTKVAIEKATYSTDDTERVFEVEEPIAENATSYEFKYDGVYTFDFTVENKKGSDDGQITVSTVDAVRAETKVEPIFAALEKTLSWEAVEGATGYRVEYGSQKADVTTTSYSFAEAEDGEYTITVSPIYNKLIYPTSSAQLVAYVGAVTTPLILERDPFSYTVSWQERPFAVSYEVTEGDATPVILGADVTEYTLTGTYQPNDLVTVKVVAKFEDKQSDDATIDLPYGMLTVTMKGMNLVEDPAGGIAETTGIESVVVGEFAADSFVMVEFTGKNAPNYAFRAETQVTELKRGISNAYWSKAGIMYFNSFLASGKNNWKDYITSFRGFGSGTTISPDMRDNGGNTVVKGEGAGLSSFKDGVKYIQIVGYEIVEDSEKNEVLRSVYAFRIEEDGTLTQLGLTNAQVKLAHSSHAISANGNKTIIYPHNNIVDLKTDDITFTYYPAAENLADLINNTHSPYKAQLQTIFGLNEEVES